MKLLLTVSFLTLVSLNCNSQYLPINFNDCKIDSFFTVVEQEPLFNIESLPIEDYFNQYFTKARACTNYTGKVILGILIFEDGSPCCYSFTNMSQKDINPELFREAVNNMPPWTPAKQKNKAVPFLLQLPFSFKNGKINKP